MNKQELENEEVRQELEQPIYVKPNLIAENGKPF